MKFRHLLGLVALLFVSMGLDAAAAQTTQPSSIVAVAGNPKSGLKPCLDTITSVRASNCTLAPYPGRDFNVSVWGTFSATYQMERSFDGVTWLPITAAGTQLYQWTIPASEAASDGEWGVKYRVNVTAYSSGTLNVRISQ